MKRQNNHRKEQASLLFLSLKASATGYGFWTVWTRPGLWGLTANTQDVLLMVLAVLLAHGVIAVTAETWRRWMNFRKFVRGVRGDGSRGNANWLSVKEAKAAGLDKRKTNAVFAGILHRIPLWLWTETHHLVIGPAGSAKSSAAIFNILASISCSCLVSDIKKEIHQVMAPLQRWRGYKIVRLDPTDPKSDCINPLDLITEQLLAGSANAISYAQDMALQLLPEPKHSGENTHFRQGSRRIIVSVMLALAAISGRGTATLSEVYLTLVSQQKLHEVLDQALKSDALGGEVRARAADLHAMAFAEDSRNFENFQVGAINVLEPFGPGNHLHSITSKTTFDFARMKSERIACYLLVDFANIKVFAPWSGLMQYIAARQLVAVGNTVPVKFVLDEFCNAPLHMLPEILTLLRGFGISVVMATQDIADVTRVYSKEALETIKSESDIKQFLSGVRNQVTLDFISKLLGNYSEVTSSFSFGEDGPRENVSVTNRPLMSADEIRRMSKDHQIIIFGNLKPIFAQKIQVFAIMPWRFLIGINKLYGSSRFLKPVAVHVWGTWSWVTRRARTRVAKSRAFWRIIGYVLQGLIPPRIVPILSVLAFCIWQLGAPHMLWEYALAGNHRTYSWCQYIGPKSLVIRGRPCPFILLQKHW